MANFSVAKNNFTSGELDPKMHSRDDIAQYTNGLEIGACSVHAPVFNQ